MSRNTDRVMRESEPARARLAGAPADLVTSPRAYDLAHFVPPLGASAVAAALALAAAALRLQARET